MFFFQVCSAVLSNYLLIDLVRPRANINTESVVSFFWALVMSCFVSDLNTEKEKCKFGANLTLHFTVVQK